MELAGADDVLSVKGAAQQAGHRGVQAGAGDEEVVVGPPLSGQQARVGQDRKAGFHARVLPHGLIQLILNGPLPGPAVHKLNVLRPVPLQNVLHRHMVNAPPTDDGNGVVLHRGVVPEGQIPLDQNADRGARPGQGDKRRVLPLVPPYLFGHSGHCFRRHAGVSGQGVPVGRQVGGRGHVFDGQHLRVVHAPLDSLLPLPGPQGLHHAGDVFQQYFDVAVSISTKHRFLPE